MNPKQQAYETLANTIIKNLSKRNIEGFYCADSRSAISLAMNIIGKNSTVSFGGSSTLKETGLIDVLKNSSNHIIDPFFAKTKEEKRQFYINCITSDYFLMSSNAITIDGELINIDGNGNRVACLIHGPEHVILLVGMNKVVPDVNTGISRVQNTAASINAVSLNKKTPCNLNGHCGNCHGEDCMCCQVVITRHSRHIGRIKVILIGETLGF
ncbi:lactate utilization protein [Faecalimonas sp.]